MSTSSRLLRLLSLLQTPRDWTGVGARRSGWRSARGPCATTSSACATSATRSTRPAGRSAATGWRRGRRCRRCCSRTTRRWRSRSAADGDGRGGRPGIEETSLRALAKLEQVLPPRLRRQVATAPERDDAGPARPAGPDRRPAGARPSSRGSPASTSRSASTTPTARRGVDPAARRAVPDRATPASAGTSWRGTSTAPTGGRSASTGCAPGCRRDRGSRRARSPTRRPRRWSPAASRPRRAGTRRGSSSTCRRTGSRSGVGPWIGHGRAARRERHACSSRAPSGSRTWRSTSGLLGADFRVTEPPELVEALRVLARRYVWARQRASSGVTRPPGQTSGPPITPTRSPDRSTSRRSTTPSSATCWAASTPPRCARRRTSCSWLRSGDTGCSFDPARPGS